MTVCLTIAQGFQGTLLPFRCWRIRDILTLSSQ
jgi:hypothetical protein